MTNEELNAEIAEYCGWRNIIEKDYQPFGTNEYIDGPSQVLVGIHPESDVDSKEYEVIPDYCNDLNVMHELENTLYKGFIDKDYWQKGYGRFQNLLGELSTNPYSANARQRAEAFLRTIGKWKD
jgi:hypothetical protein